SPASPRAPTSRTATRCAASSTKSRPGDCTKSAPRYTPDRLDCGAMIRADGLIKDFGPLRALAGLSFSVEPGEIYGLLGPNGAGKTTALRLLSGLLQPSAGSAWVGGHSIASDPPAVRASVGILTEVPGLYLRLTPIEYLDFFAQVHSLGSRRAARIEE